MKTKFIMLLSTSSLAACTTVDNGNRGVFLEYGKATEVVGEGLYWYNPWSTDVVEVSVQQMTWNGKTLAYTKDVQQATIQFAMTYHLSPDAVLATYRDVGPEWNFKLVPQVVYQSIKNIMGQARAVEDVINNRQSVTSQIFDDLSKKMLKKGIIVDGFEIADVQFEQAFEDAVERKQIAAQDAETAQNKTVEIQERAKQRVIAAQADAEAMKIKTAALAGNAKLVEYEAVQKWNGVLPQQMYGGNIPFVKVAQ